MSVLGPRGRTFDDPLKALDYVQSRLERVMAEIDTVFDQIGGKERFSTDELIPRADITEDKDTRYYTMELPGVKPEDLRITVEDHTLTVHGVKRHEKRSKDENHRRFERSYGEFTRTFGLPEGVNADKIHAELDHGVLEVRLPLPTSVRGAVKEIAIASGGHSGGQRLKSARADGHQAVVT